jgi:hypothetical protein
LLGTIINRRLHPTIIIRRRPTIIICRRLTLFNCGPTLINRRPTLIDRRPTLINRRPPTIIKRRLSTIINCHCCLRPTILDRPPRIRPPTLILNCRHPSCLTIAAAQGSYSAGYFLSPRNNASFKPPLPRIIHWYLCPTIDIDLG